MTTQHAKSNAREGDGVAGLPLSDELRIESGIATDASTKARLLRMAGDAARLEASIPIGTLNVAQVSPRETAAFPYWDDAAIAKLPAGEYRLTATKQPTER